MPKIPGVTRDLLQKQILELLEGLGIPAKEWIGKGGSKVRRLVTKTDISPFKPNMLGAMSQGKKTFGDALDAFSNEAKYIMNANDQELMNFKNNISDYTSLGGKPGGAGVGSLMKDLETSLKDLETSAKDLKLSSEAAKDLAEEEMKSVLETAQYGSPFKVPDKTSIGGNMYTEGNIRTALREFMRSEQKAGRLKLNETDTFRITEYSPMSEDDPIDVFRRHYGEDALDQVADIAKVFEKGESFSHYEQLLRENVDPSVLTLKKTGAGEYDLNVKAAEDIRTKVEEGKIEPLKPDPDPKAKVEEEKFKLKWDEEKGELYADPSKPDPDDIPFNQGGRVGLKYGSKKLFTFTKKQLLDAVNDIFPTGDRKYDAEMVGDALVENNPKMFQNRLRQDLNDMEYSEIYGTALDALDAFNREARDLIKKQKGVGSLIKKVNEEFGEGTAKRASDLPKGTKYEELEAIKAFEERNPIEAKPKIDWEDPKIKSALDKAGQKGIALSDAAKIMGYDMSKQKDYFLFEEAISGGMEGWPKEIKEQVIRAKYGDVVDERLLNNMLVDDDHFRLAEVFATVEQGLKMQEQGMGGEEILTAIKADLDRKPNAAGGGVGSMFRGV